jgi:hypothetical protein
MPRIGKWVEKLKVAKQASRPKACSTMGMIAQGLIQDYLGLDGRVLEVDRFCTALVQALYDAYAQGWKDCEEVRTGEGTRSSKHLINP